MTAADVVREFKRRKLPMPYRKPAAHASKMMSHLYKRGLLDRTAMGRYCILDHPMNSDSSDLEDEEKDDADSDDAEEDKKERPSSEDDKEDDKDNQDDQDDKDDEDNDDETDDKEDDNDNDEKDGDDKDEAPSSSSEDPAKPKTNRTPTKKNSLPDKVLRMFAEVARPMTAEDVIDECDRRGVELNSKQKTSAMLAWLVKRGLLKRIRQGLYITVDEG
eukprot:TRINITY_DN7805_c0_g1_i1.p2 TRINITY_DN7805_c0_g1~~TRINITY_DN7805_c0_g1_i1.p2  ORF type:complete len:218 (+),score=88.09 TRINITY_DN7805_c0_g1_i1:1102-1755(+)